MNKSLSCHPISKIIRRKRKTRYEYRIIRLYIMFDIVMPDDAWILNVKKIVVLCIVCSRCNLCVRLSIYCNKMHVAHDQHRIMQNIARLMMFFEWLFSCECHESAMIDEEEKRRSSEQSNLGISTINFF